MLLRCFDHCLDTAVFNETDDDAFVDYELRDLASIRALVARSAASHVVFKPTADGNRAAEVMDALPGSRAIWIYRNYLDVIGSALVQFRETSLQYLEKVSIRSPEARWRSINITDSDISFIRSHLSRGVTEESARALIWYVRNDFFFRQQLDGRPDALLLNYEDLVRDPSTVVAGAYDFIGLRFKRAYAASVFGTSVGRRPAPKVDADIDALCRSMLDRLNERCVGAGSLNNTNATGIRASGATAVGSAS
jgi:hypothetical protein